MFHYEVHFDRFRPDIKAGWREVPGPGAGILYDLGAHLIDQSLQLFGMPRAVTADIIAQRAGAEVDDYFHLVLDYFPLRVILHAATLVVQPGPRFIVHGDGGSFLKYGMDGQEEALKQGQRPGDPQWGGDSPEQLWRADSGGRDSTQGGNAARRIRAVLPSPRGVPGKRRAAAGRCA